MKRLSDNYFLKCDKASCILKNACTFRTKLDGKVCCALGLIPEITKFVYIKISWYTWFLHVHATLRLNSYITSGQLVLPARSPLQHCTTCWLLVVLSSSYRGLWEQECQSSKPLQPSHSHCRGECLGKGRRCVEHTFSAKKIVSNRLTNTLTLAGMRKIWCVSQRDLGLGL